MTSIYLQAITSFSFHVVPSMSPEKPNAHNSSSTSFIVSWKVIPSDFIHGILRGYFLFYRTKQSHVWKNITVDPETHQVELKGLRKFQKYYVQLAGFTRKGIGRSCKQIPVLTDEDGKNFALQNFRM